MSATPSTPVPAFRGRIGRDARSGHYAVPHRYRLHLSLSCPSSLRIAVTHHLLGLADVLPVTLLPAAPDAADGGYTALRPLYDASAHQYPGPASVPVLSDGWTGRIVSTHAPDILRDLALRFGEGGPELYPRELGAEIDEVARLCETSIHEAAQHAGELGIEGDGHEAPLGVLLGALDSLERGLTGRRYIAGDRLTAADVHLWVTLVQLDTVHRWHLDAGAVHQVADHPRLWAYAQRLTAHPAFAAHLDADGIARRHHARCRGREAAGAAMPIVDWEAARCAPAETRPAARQPRTPAATEARTARP
ncbi:glutathione S-transferase C-terminal domain-containing protein [Streptomyces sp. SP18CS02]|uniref:glutathione S-transferase C-terminal domain-containing protein n=1 Tax=Streptomyces sp. SP18CS02 TaxID=3002531 RepID=UPI002E761FAC|nr:glutathione S-transferase C-terminal domain-containing protein [Streptomyces sp. SP18CS02]MEE1754669.1 glutathione S-transferase C-terminal domain-containing protein [Streptomyces sp. SP18CS02]